MEKARFILASVIASVTLLAACAYDAPEKPYVTDQRFTEPTFFCMQPVATTTSSASKRWSPDVTT